MPLDRPLFVSQQLLGSEAVYEILEEHDELVTACVVRAPGLPSGMHVSLLARAARAMKRTEIAQPAGRTIASATSPQVAQPAERATPTAQKPPELPVGAR